MINKKGFTLVEVMITMGLIAILATIAIPNVLRARISANEASAKATLKSIANALENYYAANTQYPTNSNLLLSAQPPYLNVDYFTGTHNGYSFTSTLQNYSYTIIGSPSGALGSTTFTITTGGLFQ